MSIKIIRLLWYFMDSFTYLIFIDSPYKIFGFAWVDPQMYKIKNFKNLF